VVAVVFGGLGVVGAALGSVFAASAASTLNIAKGECTTTYCSSAGHAQAVQDRDSANSSATMSTVAFVAAGALLAGGAVLYFTALPKSAKSEALKITPTVTAGGGGLIVRGGF
jgi:hypothetical protein